MKKIWLLLFLVHFTYPLIAQDWIRYYGYGKQPYSSYCIEQYDKGYVLLGDINNYKYGWIVKTDINGNELWNIKIGDGVHNTMPANIEQTHDKGFILCGSTTLFNSPHSDPFIIKLNSCGDIEWCKVLIYDNAGDGAIRVKQTMDGGYVLCAILYGDIPNNIVHLFKFDSTGELFWHKIYNGDSLVESEFIRDLYVDQQFFLLTGECYYPNWLKPYYIQTDTSGNETWSLAYSQHTGLGFVGASFASVRDIHGNYYSAGSREDTYPELIKFSAIGEEMMNTDLFPSATSGGAGTILALNDTSYIMCAEWNVGSPAYLGILRTDTLGDIKKIKYLPNPGNVIISWTAKTNDNKILLIVTDYIGANSRIELFKFNSNLEYDSIYTHPFVYDSLCPHPIVSDTIMPSCIIVGLQEPLTNAETAALKVFPNPANQKITVEFPKYVVVKTGLPGFGSTTVYHHWKSTTLEVYELSGKKVFEKEIVRAQNTFEMDVSKWPRGMYYFRLVYNKHVVAGERVVVE